jgi:hypothetical protein
MRRCRRSFRWLRRVRDRGNLTSQSASRSHRLHFESLEDRRVLSAALPQVEFFGTSPALFVENQGQWADASVRYFHQGNGANVAMLDSGVAFQLVRCEPLADPEAEPAATSLARWRNDRRGAPSASTELLQFSAEFVGAATVSPVGLRPSEARFNYFIGDPTNWRSEVPSYEVVAFEGLYPGIDLHTWGLHSSLKYEFHVAPGADWSQIQVRYDGIAGLSLTDDGALAVTLGDSWGQWQDDAPYIYQVIDGHQVEVAGRFELVDDVTYTFAVTGPYDATAPLIIDPDLAWSTYLGGSGNDRVYDLTTDAEGHILLTGTTNSSGWISGGYDTGLSGIDAFVVKLSPEGGHVWSTYYGGSADESGNSIATDSNGNVLVTGEAISSSTSSNTFVVKLNSEGRSPSSTTLDYDRVDWGGAIAVDSANNVLIAGVYAWSDSGSAGFVTKLSPTLNSVWSVDLSYYASGVAVDAANNVFVSSEGDSGALVRKLNSAGTTQWTSNFGDSGDYATGIDVDADGNVLVTGYTVSSGWTATGYNTVYGGGGDGFVAKLNTANGARLWSTYLGGGNEDIGWDVAVDDAGDVLVTGQTASGGWVSGGFDVIHNGNADAFVVRLNSLGGHIESTYLGGSQNEIGWSVEADGEGAIVVAGETQSSGWISGTHNGAADGFVVKLPLPNEPPLIEGLAGTPNPVIRPAALTLAATGVNDPDGEVVQVQFYRDTNGDSQWDAGDALLGADTDGSGGWTWTGGTAAWTLGLQTFFARAQDDGDAWSEPVSAAAAVENAVPVVTGFSAAPNPVPRPDALTLTADGVSDPDGSVASVEFYRDANGDGQWDAGDVLLGADVDGGDGWSWSGGTADWTPGQHTFFARALDNDDAWSTPVDATGTVDNAAPLVTTLLIASDPVTRPEALTLTADGVSDPDGSVARVEFYRDANGDSQWDAGDALLGADVDGSDGWSWNGGTAGWTPGPYTFFARAQDNDAAWSGPVSATAAVENAIPIVGSLSGDRNPVPLFGSLTLEAKDVNDPDGGVDRVEFYRDTNGDSGWDEGDQLLGADEDGANGWSWTGGTAGWTLGEHTFFARARDNDGAWSEAAMGSVTVAEWQNLNNQFDVDGNGQVDAGDVLVLVNTINSNEEPALPPRSPDNVHWPFYDVNGDDYLTPLDVLLVIEFINSETPPPTSAGGAGEGEWAAEWVGERLWPPPAAAIANLPETQRDGELSDADGLPAWAAGNGWLPLPYEEAGDGPTQPAGKPLLQDRLLDEVSLDAYFAALG